MREMQEIESQRSAIPPVPASKVKDHINNDAWALQYLEDGKSFAVSSFLPTIFSSRLNISLFRITRITKQFGRKLVRGNRN